jgi:hypothetical protein
MLTDISPETLTAYLDVHNRRTDLVQGHQPA